MSVTIKAERPDSAEAARLIAELEAHLEPLYPVKSRHGYSVQKLLAQGVAFFVMRDGDTPDQGVLYMRSPMVMQGYHNLPEKTGEALHDGWYRSGDIVRRDENGFYYFVGRADDMFVSGGENIHPGEIEAMLERHPDIHQAVVVPIDDELKFKKPVAFVVTRPGATPSEAVIQQFALANAAPYLHPRRVWFVPEMPLAGTNKIDRLALTERAAQLLTTS